MTPDEIDALPAGPDLDALVLEKVMGWERRVLHLPRRAQGGGRVTMELKALGFEQMKGQFLLTDLHAVAWTTLPTCWLWFTETATYTDRGFWARG